MNVQEFAGRVRQVIGDCARYDTLDAYGTTWTGERYYPGGINNDSPQFIGLLGAIELVRIETGANAAYADFIDNLKCVAELAGFARLCDWLSHGAVEHRHVIAAIDRVRRAYQ